MTRRARGYTVVELMMSLAVFATGVTGVIAMERATVTSNQVGKNVAIANGIAHAWLSALAADGTLWTRGNDVSKTLWLATIATADDRWQLPTYDPTRAFGPQFDGFGAPIAANGVFCAQIRLTWLYGDTSAQQTTGMAGNGVIRTEVRVFWPRDESNRVAGDCANNTQATSDAITAGIKSGMYHAVIQAGAVRQPG